VLLEPRVIEVVGRVDVGAVLVVRRVRELQQHPDLALLDRPPVLLAELDDVAVVLRVFDVRVGDVLLSAAERAEQGGQRERDRNEGSHPVIGNAAGAAHIPARNLPNGRHWDKSPVLIRPKRAITPAIPALPTAPRARSACRSAAGRRAKSTPPAPRGGAAPSPRLPRSR